MHCSDCKTKRIARTTYNTWVCLGCGIEKLAGLIPTNDDPSNAYNQLTFQYSRRQRFKNYLEQVTGISSGCHSNAKIWELLNDIGPFESVELLLKAMGKVKCKHKHYECIHSFARAFVTDCPTPERVTMVRFKFLMRSFDEILLNWKRHFDGTTELFFSYPWITKHLLHSHGITRFDVFIKKLQCKKRNQKYVKLLQKISVAPKINEIRVPNGDDLKRDIRSRNKSADQLLYHNLFEYLSV